MILWSPDNYITIFISKLQQDILQALLPILLPVQAELQLLLMVSNERLSSLEQTIARLPPQPTLPPHSKYNTYHLPC